MDNCPWCLEFAHKEVKRGKGNECTECGHWMTCDLCDFEDCEFRDDLYNTDGDCLMEK